VTQQVLALEESLGLRVLERGRGGTLLTTAGRALLPNARRVLEEFQSFCDQGASIATGPAGTYRLGVTPTLGPYLLPRILPAIHQRYAALKLYVREAAPRDLESGLASGEHDLILTPLPVGETNFNVAPLFEEPVLLVMSTEHRLATRDRVTREDLAGEPVLRLEEHHQFHQQIQQLCARLGAHVLREYEGTSLDTLRQMVVMGMGIAFLPALYALSETHGSLPLHVTSIFDEPVHRTHALVWRRSSPNGQLFQEIAGEIRSLVDRSLEGEVKTIDPESFGA